MAIQDTASAILKRLEEGTEAIYARYREKALQTDASYQQKLKDLDADYGAAARDLSGKAEVGLRDTLTGLSDLGLQNSGAAEQARISNRTALLRSLGELSVRRAKDRSAADAERSAAAADLAREGEEKAGSYRDSMFRLLVQQQNADREFEAKAEQDREKMALEREKLALQNRTAAQNYQIRLQQAAGKTSSAKSGTDGTEEGVKLDQTPAKVMETIIQASRRYNKAEKYYYTDRKTVQKYVAQILKDERLSETYRYQFYAQARARGYVE